MSPSVATVACLLFVVYLFWADTRTHGRQSISWIPFIWMFIAGSRFVSTWVNMRAPMASADAYAEGSPVDRVVFLVLIVSGVITLLRRDIPWVQLLKRNRWIVLYFLYCLLSVVWTDQPFVLIKRWVKELGVPIMVLVMLTEPVPYEAVLITLRRLSYLFLPLSVLFVKYYPALGRGYRHDGSPLYTGIGSQKNDLGLMCFIAGFYFAWKYLNKQRADITAHTAIINDLLLIGMLSWLLTLSDSKTSIVCLGAVVAMLLVAKLPLLASRPSRVITLVGVSALVFVALERVFNITEFLLPLLGRDSTLTSRTKIWAVVESLEGNSIVGAGFMSFWSGQRMETIWRAVGARLNQAHNGYLEQYLNLGYLGVGFIVLIMLAALLTARRELSTDPSGGMIKVCLLAAAALYNYTEASFYGVNNMWLLLQVACLDTDGLMTAPFTPESRSHHLRRANRTGLGILRPRYTSDPMRLRATPAIAVRDSPDSEAMIALGSSILADRSASRPGGRSGEHSSAHPRRRT